MASRTKQKEEARARRLAEQRERAERARQQRRFRMLGGTVLAVAVVLAVVIVISVTGSSNGPNAAVTGPPARNAAAAVESALSAIPQSGSRLGSPSAKVTVTEFGDLECPICKDFALGAESTLISNDVRSGKVALVFRSLCTATCNGPNPSAFPTQQAAAEAAGLQNRQWDYILLFYHLQGSETTSYVNDSYLDGLARLIPGINYAKWLSDRSSGSLTTQVTSDQQAAAAKGFNSTPTLLIQGPKGAQQITGNTDYNTLESAIKTVQ
jgi:protein-disulfide isomerase